MQSGSAAKNGAAFTAADVARSPLRWAGSKRKLIPTLMELAPTRYERYVEPFCGSLCLFVALKPRRALVGDINEELIHFYRSVKRDAQQVASIAHGIDKHENTYYELRAVSPRDMSHEQRAARFLYLNRYCFNGVYRTNLLGQFNVARGKHMGEIPPVDELVAFGTLMRRVTVRNCDFEELLSECRGGDFCYLDPPYAGRDVRDRGEYGLGAFKEADLERMVDTVSRAARRGAKILISYADLPSIRRAFRGWHVERIEVGRNVSGFCRGRGKVRELVIRNYP